MQKSLKPAVWILIMMAVMGFGACDDAGGGSNDKTHYIYTVEDLNAVRGGIDGYGSWDLDGDYKLMKDLDLDVAPYNQGTGWAPIGTDDSAPFTGTFDGNNHVISNLFIDDADTPYKGLFGNINEAVITNLGVESVDVTGNFNTGGLVGYCKNSTLTNCHSGGSVTGSNVGTGGLVGMNEGYIGGSDRNTSLTDCYSTATVSGYNSTGGLAGYNDYAIITNCHASGTVTGSNEGTGGLAGYTAYSSITGCYASGTVFGTGVCTGGLMGMADGSTITDSYAVGAVTGNDRTGGLIGYNNATVINCYATGAVDGSTDYKGGLVGGNKTGTFTSCFYDTTTTGMTAANQNYGTPTTTENMKLQATFTVADPAWDFAAVWGISSTINSGYPYLRDNHE